MSDLEKYIKENSRKMDAAEPASGHELRFLDKLEDAGLVEKKTVRLNWRRLTLAVSVAAAIIVGFVLIKPAEEIALIKHTDWFANAENTPEGVYEAYYNQFQKDCQEVSAYDGEDVIEDITNEPIPLIDQLPDELSDAEKVAILQEHYGNLLDAVAQYKETLAR